MDVNRKAHPDCKYSKNPFHECASDCLEKIAQSPGKKNPKKQASKILSLPGSFGKKKTDSHPPSPLNTKQYQNGVVSDSPRVHQSRPSPVAVKKKENAFQEAYKSFPTSLSNDISIDLNVQHNREKPSRTVPLSPSNMADRRITVSPRPREHEQQDNGKNETASEITVFNVVSPPRSYANDDDDDDDENGIELDLESVMSDSCVSVGKYRVNSSVSTILQSIIDKHGDIAANCKLESASMRSRYLECLCSLMQELGTTPVGHMTKLKVKEMLAVLIDIESVNINVGWLRLVLEEFACYQENTDSEKDRQEELVRSKKQELEIQEEDLAQIEKEVMEAKLKVEEMKLELDKLEMERSKMEDIGFQVEKFKGKSFLDELL